MSWKIVFSKHAQKDAKKLRTAGLKDQAIELLEILKKDPFQSPPRFEKLIGDHEGDYSRRINVRYRLVYQILEKDKTVKIIRMWKHYE